ncbi:hypothetical protein ACIA8O_04750 [Kitasatospora sp. NPDC051853]|uniref:hypothetical protein n=1 Tax=Kitasatospora sp. NPDC051853 TaxID=3364058 RepID=UPI003795CE7F
MHAPGGPPDVGGRPVAGGRRAVLFALAATAPALTAHHVATAGHGVRAAGPVVLVAYVLATALLARLLLALDSRGPALRRLGRRIWRTVIPAVTGPVRPGPGPGGRPGAVPTGGRIRRLMLVHALVRRGPPAASRRGDAVRRTATRHA